MKKILLAILLPLLFACAKQAPVAPPEATGLDKPWQLLTEISRQNDGPSRLGLSLRFGREGDTRRVTALLWSNDYKTVRLDVMAGVGTAVAKILDQPDHFLLVAPTENRAFEHSGSNRPLLRVGAPLPFNLSQLAELLAGHYAQVFGASPGSARQDGENVKYELEKPAGGSLEVAADGLPANWKTGGWNVRFRYGDDQTVPSSLRLTGQDGKIAVLLVKNREYPGEAFSERQMELKAPAGTRLLPLSQYKP